ncbi:MAG: hypothetical protein ACI4E5_01530 [Suilimivivens sp.]
MKFEDVKYRLNPGEEVRILKGVTFYAKPSKVVFIKEYPNHLLFEGTFEDGKEVYGVRTRRFSINKPSLWCGDAKVQRVSDGSFVGMKEGEDNE